MFLSRIQNYHLGRKVAFKLWNFDNGIMISRLPRTYCVSKEGRTSSLHNEALPIFQIIKSYFPSYSDKTKIENYSLEIGSYLNWKMRTTAENYLHKAIQNGIIWDFNWNKEHWHRSPIRVTNFVKVVKTKKDNDEDNFYKLFNIECPQIVVSVRNIAEDALEIRTSDGGIYLGGTNLESVIIHYIVNCISQEQCVDINPDIQIYSMLQKIARKACVNVLLKNEATLDIFHFFEDTPQMNASLTFTIIPFDFDEFVTNLTKSSLEVCKFIIAEAQKTSNHKSFYLLGSIEKTETESPLNKVHSEDSREVIVMLASTQGKVHFGEMEDVLLFDITTEAISMITSDDRYHLLMKAYSPIPFSKVEKFSIPGKGKQTVNFYCDQNYLGKCCPINTQLDNSDLLVELKVEEDGHVYMQMQKEDITLVKSRKLMIGEILP